MNNFLAWLGALTVALLAALFAVPAMIDWNGYRGIFEEEATRVLGRDVRLGGAVNLRLLPAPYVSFEKLRISDPGSQTGEPLFHADSFTMWLAISPLLRGVLQANQVELVKPVVKLAVNERGEGNWSTLELAPGSLPFVPADVMLNSVKLTEGEFGLVGPRGNELGRLAKINGEFSADTIRGPYRFRGRLDWSGATQEVRMATGAPEANGEIRFKVSVASSGTHSSYVLDGKATDFSGKPKITGALAAKIAPDLTSTEVAGQPATTAPAPISKPTVEPAPVIIRPGPIEDAKVEVPLPTAANVDGPLYDFRSKVEGDTSGFKLSEISVTSEGAGPPQLITGDAQLDWRDKTKLHLSLNSRWLDLDALFGKTPSGPQVVPLEAARGLFDTLMRMLPATADTNVTLAVDQVNLGADQISNVKVAAVRAGGPLELREFQVGLPGQTQLTLNGKLAPGELTPKFEGAIGLKGQNLLRFLAWGLRRPAITEGRSDGPFAINGKLKFSGKLIELADAKVGVSDVPVSGGVRLDLTERRRLTVNLEGQKIDVGRLWPGSLRIEALAPLLAEANAAATEAKPEERWFDLANSDLSVGIKAGAVVDGERKLRDVEADVSVEKGKLAIRSLKFGSDEGLEVELDGEAADLDAQAQGSVRGLISAPDAAAAQTFVRLAGLGTYAPDLATWIENLAPLRLAGTVRLGGRGEHAVDLNLDGLVRGGGRLVGSFELDGGVANWRSAPANVMLRIDTPDVDQSLAALMDDSGQNASSPARSGRIVARAVGIAETGLMTFAAVESDGLAIDYSGKALLPSSSPLALDGELKVAGRDTRTMLALAGIKLPAGAADVPVVGRLAIAKSGNETTLRPSQLSIGGTPVAGEVKITRDDARSIVSANLEAGEATVPGLLTAFLERPPQQPEQASTPPPAPTPSGRADAGQSVPSPADASIWPEQGFDFTAVDKLEGTLSLRLARLSLEPGLGIGNAKLDIALKPGRIDVTSLEGDALGGKAQGKWMFEKAAAGVNFDGSLKVVVAGAGQDGRSAEPSKDAANLDLKFSGRALSPQALIADLKGTGELKLGDVQLSGMSPVVVAAVSEAAMLGQGPQNGEALVTALRDGLKKGELPLGSVTVPVTIADGSLKLAKIELDRTEGRTSFETVIELATMKVDSEWNVEARLPKTAGRAAEKLLPPVSVVYSGKLKDIVTLEPAISVAALERELTVRKMERDVDELERLRKLDEQRAKEEQERIKAERERAKAERDKAAAAAAAAAAVDDPQPDPVPGAPVEQQSLPPVDGVATGQSGQADAAGSATPAAAEQQAVQDAGAQPRPASPPKRRKPQQDNWNPFTNPF